VRPRAKYARLLGGGESPNARSLSRFHQLVVRHPRGRALPSQGIRLIFRVSVNAGVDLSSTLDPCPMGRHAEIHAGSSRARAGARYASAESADIRIFR